MNIQSKLLQKATDEFSKLPGIGKKTALRLVLSLLKMNKKDVNNFTSTIDKLKFEIKNCISCLLYTSPSPRDRKKSSMAS